MIDYCNLKILTLIQHFFCTYYNAVSVLYTLNITTTDKVQNPGDT